MFQWFKKHKIPTIFISVLIIISIIYGIGSGLGFLSSKDTYEKLIPIGHPNRPAIKNNPVAVVIHYTGNSSFTATDFANRNYFARKFVYKNGKYYEADGKTPFRYASSNWIIDQDSATLVIPQTEGSFHAGDKQLPLNNGCNGQTRIAKEVFNYQQNYKSISYEICNNANWDKACENAIEVIAKDMVTYNIPTSNIFTHEMLTNKKCPLPFVNDTKAWESFKQKIINRVNELKTVSVQKKQIKFIINGKQTNIDGLYESTGINYVGVRNLLEQMGYTVIWHQDTQTIEVK